MLGICYGKKNLKYFLYPLNVSIPLSGKFGSLYILQFFTRNWFKRFAFKFVVVECNATEKETHECVLNRFIWYKVHMDMDFAESVNNNKKNSIAVYQHLLDYVMWLQIKKFLHWYAGK